MPRFAKSPPALIARFSSLLPKHPDVEARKMFGYPCAFVRGNFWVGLFEDGVVIRLPDGLHARIPSLRGAAHFDPMGGRPMKDWFAIPRSVVDDDRALGRLLADTLPLVLALPPKAPRPKKARRATDPQSARTGAPRDSGTSRAATVTATKKKIAKKKTAETKTARKKTAKKTTKVRR